MRSIMAPRRRGSKTAKKQIGPTPANGNLAPVIAMSVPAINATERSRCNTETTTLRERQRALPRPIKWAPKSNMPSAILRWGLRGGVPKGGNCYPGETWRRRASTTSVHAVAGAQARHAGDVEWCFLSCRACHKRQPQRVRAPARTSVTCTTARTKAPRRSLLSVLRAELDSSTSTRTRCTAYAGPRTAVDDLRRSCAAAACPRRRAERRALGNKRHWVLCSLRRSWLCSRIAEGAAPFAPSEPADIRLAALGNAFHRALVRSSRSRVCVSPSRACRACGADRCTCV